MDSVKRKVDKELLCLGVVILLFLILQSPLVDKPYHYDAMVWVPQTKYLVENGPFAIPPEDYGHPAMLFWTLGIAYFLFGESVVVSHMTILLYAVIAIVFTYLIGKELFDKRIALLASAFVAFQPWFFVVSTWTYYDIPLTAGFAVSMYFFIRAIKTEKIIYYILFAIFGSITSLLKEPGVLIALIPTAYLLLKKDFRMKNVIFLIPIIPIGLWGAWHYYMTGSVFTQGNFSHILLPTNPTNVFLLVRNISSNVFFAFIQNGNFIATLAITYALFVKRYKNLFLALVILFFLAAPYSFELVEPDTKFYPFLLIINVFFSLWVFMIPKVDDKYKILVLWMAAIMLHSLFEQISFRYTLPLVPAFALMFSSAVMKLKEQKFIVPIIFILFALQLVNYSAYYLHRDIIYDNIFEFFAENETEKAMVTYPLATQASIAVGNIDSRPWGDIELYLTPNEKESFETINPQYLVVDVRSEPYKLDYIQGIVKTETPVAVYSDTINWITFYGMREKFINTLLIYKFY